MKVKYNLVVRVGAYMDRNGEKKHNYKTIGKFMEDDQGHGFILLDKFFNPAGVICDAEKSQIPVSLFEPKKETKEFNNEPNYNRGISSGNMHNNDFDNGTPF